MRKKLLQNKARLTGSAPALT